MWIILSLFASVKLIFDKIFDCYCKMYPHKRISYESNSKQNHRIQSKIVASYKLSKLQKAKAVKSNPKSKPKLKKLDRLS